MSSKVQQRLEELQKEYEAGQKRLAELDARRQELASTLMRIEGAIQVLRELLEAEAAPGEA